MRELIDRNSRHIVVLLVAVLLLGLLPAGVGANINHDGGYTNSSGHGDVREEFSVTSYDNNWGIRVTPYWAPTPEHFTGKTPKQKEEIIQVAAPKDYTNHNPVGKYATVHSTGFSAYDYRARGEQIKLRHISWLPYNRQLGGAVVREMPHPVNAPSSEWKRFWRGSNPDNPDYTNVGLVFKNMGLDITAEDFRTGRLPRKGGDVYGQYKLFFEPVFYARVGGHGTALSIRDAVAWEEKYVADGHTNRHFGTSYSPAGPYRLVETISPMIPKGANAHYLAYDEPILNMKRKAPSYKAQNKDLSELRQAVAKGGAINKSMGVGVVTPENVERESALASFVEVVDYDGLEFKYRKIIDTVEIPIEYEVGLEAERIMTVPEVVYLDGVGFAVINDVITTRVNIKDKIKSGIEGVEWKEGTEPREGGRGLVTDKEVFGRLHGLVLHNFELEELEIDESYTKKQQIEVGIDKIMSEMRGEPSASRLEAEANQKNKEGYYTSKKEKGQSVSKKYTSIKDISIGVPEGQSLEDGTYAKSAHLRYIVIPESMQHHVKATKLNGKTIQVKQYDSMPLDMPSTGMPEDVKIYQRHDMEELVKWYIVESGAVPDLVTGYPGSLPPPKPESEGGLSGTGTLTIPRMTPGDSVVVVWESEEFAPTKAEREEVPEWRLSKYTEKLDWGQWAGMTMTLKPDTGHGMTSFSPSGAYNFHRINPNGKINDDSDSPANKKYNSWLHSKTISRGSDTINHDKTRTKIEVTGDLNLVKSTALDGISLAKWVKGNSNLAPYEIWTGIKGASRGSGSKVQEKKATLEYWVRNKDSYTHIYPVYHHTWSIFGSSCRCYLQQESPSPSYQKAKKEINATFDRYHQVNTDNRLNKYKSKKVEKNGRTQIAIQEGAVLNVYPEYPMLFQDNKGAYKIEFAIGDRARKIQPVTYHTMEYDFKMEPKSMGTSVATNTVARQEANRLARNKQVIHKGAGVNTNFSITGGTPGSRGKLRIKTYALDFGNAEVKSAWGNSGYSAKNANSNFLSKWTFTGQARENLLVQNPRGGNIVYTGPTKLKNNLKYTNRRQVKEETLKLEVRGGELYKVDGRTLDYYKNGNRRQKDIYEALVEMKLVGAPGSTVFSTFEVNQGKELKETRYRTEAAKARGGHDKIRDGKGWYSEDTTVLVLKIFHTEVDVPSNMYSDKLPMTIRGLETPINKGQYYRTMSRGYTRLNYKIESSNLKGLGKVKSYFEIESNKELIVNGKKLNNITIDYLVPNVSITDTMGFN